MAALSGGFVTGIAESNQLNKVWRQASIMAAVLAQLIVDVSGANAVDDGTTATLLGNLMTALQSSSFQSDVSGAANSYSLVYSPAPVSPLTDGAMYTFRPLHTNTTASTLSVNGSPAHSILSQTLAALTGGEIATGGGFVTVIYNSNLSAFVIQANSGGIQHSVTPTAGDSSTKVATTAFVAGSSFTQVIALINGSGGIVRQAGQNTISVSHTGTGMYTITFGVALADANYVVNVTANNSAAYAANWSSAGTGSFHVTLFSTASGTPTDVGFGLSVFH
jgi:hypothetical protein